MCPLHLSCHCWLQTPCNSAHTVRENTLPWLPGCLKSHQTPTSATYGSPAPLALPWSSVQPRSKHTALHVSTPLAPCSLLAVLFSFWFCPTCCFWLQSFSLDMLASPPDFFQQRQELQFGYWVYNEKKKKRQIVVKLFFTNYFSRDLCLSAYYESKSSSTVHGQPPFISSPLPRHSASVSRLTSKMQ